MTQPLGAEDEIVAAIRRIIRAVELHSRRLAEGHGVTGPQLAVLQEAHRMGGAPITALARLIHLSQPTVTGIVHRLERADLVHRCRDDTDRRTVIVRVTEAGARMLERAPSPLQERFRRELGKLEVWERTMTLASLQRIAAMMDAETLDASPVLTAGPIDPAPQGEYGEPLPGEAPIEASRTTRSTDEQRSPKKGTRKVDP